VLLEVVLIVRAAAVAAAEEEEQQVVVITATLLLVLLLAASWRAAARARTTARERMVCCVRVPRRPRAADALQGEMERAKKKTTPDARTRLSRLESSGRGEGEVLSRVW
jgi:hypothetical protein